MHPALEYIKKILDFFKGGKTAIKIGDIALHKDIINQLESEDLKNNEIVKEFNNSTVTINKNTTNIFVVTKESEIMTKVTEILKAEKDKTNGTKVNILPTGEKVDYLEFKQNEKPLNKKYTNIFDLLNNRHKALLALAINIAGLYKKDASVADATKRSVAEKYGDYGTKFCNLWVQGYLQSIFSLLMESVNKNEQDKIQNVDKVVASFIDEADSIEFIHQHSDVTKTARKINEALTAKKDYVAMHGLGSATGIANKIDKKVKNVEGEYKIVIKSTNKKYSKIWYKGDRGSQIYALIEKLL